jgi:hypothetical protein
MKIRPDGQTDAQTVRQTDRNDELIAAFQNFVNSPKMRKNF